MVNKTKNLWHPLKTGDIVDIVAPGFATSQEHLEAAIEFVKKIGLEPRVAKNIFGADIVCAQTDAIRFAQLRKALLAKDSKAVWCVRAGYGAIRILDQLSKVKKPAQPKLFIGYSDACSIHNYLNQFWRWPSLHGPLLDKLGQHTLPLEQVNELLDTIFGHSESIKFKHLIGLNKAAKKKKYINSQMVGGNLTVTHSLLGTKFMRLPKKQILFFEDTGERGYRVDRILKQMTMAGYFNFISAVIFGDFINSQDPNGEDKVPHVLKRFAEEMKVPVFAGLAVGHGMQQRPMPMATPATLITGMHAELKVLTGAQIDLTSRFKS